MKKRVFKINPIFFFLFFSFFEAFAQEPTQKLQNITTDLSWIETIKNDSIFHFIRIATIGFFTSMSLIYALIYLFYRKEARNLWFMAYTLMITLGYCTAFISQTTATNKLILYFSVLFLQLGSVITSLKITGFILKQDDEKSFSNYLKIGLGGLLIAYLGYLSGVISIQNITYKIYLVITMLIVLRCFAQFRKAYSLGIIEFPILIVVGILGTLFSVIIFPYQSIDQKYMFAVIVMSELLLPIIIAILISYLFAKNIRELQTKQLEINALILEKQVILEKQNETLAKQVAEQTAKLEALNATKDHLFSIIGHDLRSPIASLKGALQLFDNQQLSQSEFFELARHLLKNVDNIHEMLENLLQWSLSQMKGLKPHFKTFEVNEVIVETVGLFKEVANQKEIELTTDLELNLIAFADENQIRTVLRNLLNNAIKFTPNNGNVVVSGKIRDNFVELKVIDSGIGIKTEDLKSIFSKPKLKKGTAGETGTGLGLVLCKDLIEQNGGQIIVRSEYQKGTIFEVILPKNQDL